jgi:hypothetical protein
MESNSNIGREESTDDPIHTVAAQEILDQIILNTAQRIDRKFRRTTLEQRLAAVRHAVKPNYSIDMSQVEAELEELLTQ